MIDSGQKARLRFDQPEEPIGNGVPTYSRSDNGSEFTATKVPDWLARVGVKTVFIEPGSPWENSYIESFNGKEYHYEE